MALIEVRGLTKLYQMGDSVVRALDGVDLTIERGEFVAITGASGSGKSTMMHLLGCLDRPTGGTYRLDGRDVSDLSDRELAMIRNRKIGFVFQTFNLINRTTAAENVAVPLFYARRTNTNTASVRALERVGLATRAKHNPNELSGGERQRVAIARAIVNDPLLVLADEPTGNLDSRTGDQIMEIFRGLNEQGVTIIMVTHEPDIARLARRVVHMRDGRILSDRPTAELIAEEGPLPPRRDAHLPEPEPVMAQPAAAAPVAAESSAAVVAEPVRRRLVRGANAALICGLIAVACLLTAIGIGIALSRSVDLRSLDPQKPPPKEVIVAGAAAGAATLGAIVMAIVTIVVAAGPLKRLKRDPGLWYGKVRARIGQLMGFATILVLLAQIVFAALQAISRRAA